jgi:Zn-dependent alcohol dehydrogenase
LAIQGWGTTVATSVLRENASILPSHLLNGRTLKGTMYGGFKTRSDLPELVERYLRKEILVDEFITEDLPFLEINKAFQLLLSGQGLRTALHF